MRKLVFACLGIFFCSLFVQAKEPANPADFSGDWVLSFSATKNPPPGLQNYDMVVTQAQQQLKVTTSLEGDLQPTQSGADNYPGGSGGGYPGRRGGLGRIGIGWPGGGMGIPGTGRLPGGGGGRPRRQGASQGALAAYKLYPQNAVYKLDGSESTVQLGDTASTEATSKAQFAGNGEGLDLSLIGKGGTSQKGAKIELKDHWKLSQDRRTLTVDRHVKSPEGSASVRLVFFKKEVRSTASAASRP